MSSLKEGDIVFGIVTGIESYGIFVSVDDYSGLVHISEISENFVRNVGDYANVGDKLKVKILEKNDKDHQLKLSIKEFEKSKKRAKREKIIETSQGFNTLQDNLGIWVNEKISELQIK